MAQNWKQNPELSVIILSPKFNIYFNPPCTVHVFSKIAARFLKWNPRFIKWYRILLIPFSLTCSKHVSDAFNSLYVKEIGLRGVFEPQPDANKVHLLICLLHWHTHMRNCRINPWYFQQACIISCCYDTETIWTRITRHRGGRSETRYEYSGVESDKFWLIAQNESGRGL